MLSASTLGNDKHDCGGTTSSIFHIGNISEAAWGACFGWCLTSVVVFFVASGMLPLPEFLVQSNTVIAVKGPEKLFYLLFYVLGSCLAFWVAFLNNKFFRNPFSAGLGVLIFLPTAPKMAVTAITGGDQVYWLVLPQLALAASFVMDRLMTESVNTEFNSYNISHQSDRPISSWEYAGLIGGILFFAICLFPLDLTSVTALIGYNPHPVSFYIAPALFLKGDGLIPGVDFFPQYGIGLGYLFSFFLRETAEATMANTVLVTASLNLAYFTSALFLLRRLYGSLSYAFFVVLFALLLNFHTQGVQAHAIYVDPSAYPVRYPFIFLYIWLYARAAEKKKITCPSI